MSHDTLVYIFAGSIGFGRVSFGTGAIADTAGNRYALGTARTLLALRASSQHAFTIDDLVRRLTLAFDAVAFFAKREGISIEARWTLTLIAAGEIFANCVDAAGGLLSQLHAFVDVSAFTGLVVAHVTALTDAHATAHEFVLNALFSSGAGRAGTAYVRCFGLLAAAAVRIACHAARTLTREGTGLVVADSARRTRIYRALVDVSAASLYSGFSGVTVATKARRHVVQEHAVGVRSAG